MRRRSRPNANLIVLEATNPPDGTTRYIDQVVSFAGKDVAFHYLSWRSMLMSRLDVIHFHWPEVLVRGRSRPGTAARWAMFAAMLLVLRLRRVAIVRTLHNLTPHEPGPGVEAKLLRLLDRMTTLFVRINPVTQAPGRSVFIPHGHYRDRFARYARSSPEPRRVIHAGLIRPYKGIERLMRVVSDLAAEGVELRVVGRPTADLRAVIERTSAGEANISARLEFVPDEDLVAEITSATLVCLPYSELHNSGMLLVALSLGRPVLVPRSPTTSLLADEVGPGWVLTFTGELTPEVLKRALDSASRTTSDEPNLSDRDWERVGRLYTHAFKIANRLRSEPEYATSEYADMAMETRAETG